MWAELKNQGDVRYMELKVPVVFKQIIIGFDNVGCQIELYGADVDCK